MGEKNRRKRPISVIVPLFNGEKYIEKCLLSIREQSIKELEIIVVDDGSTDASAKIVERIAKEDSRVVLCKHSQNMGLFQARITGVKASTGEYIAFVDADDRVSFDWFRLLYHTACLEQNDITIGQFLCDYDEDYKTFYNLDPLRQSLCLKGDAVFQKFIEQEGSCYSWHLVWNKMYARHLWMDALGDLESFSKSHPKFVMCEDIAFSAAMWLRAKKTSTVTHGAYYFYNRSNATQSTAGETERTKTLRNITSVVSAFQFLKMQMEEYNVFERYQKHFDAFKLYYARMYYGFLKSDAHSKKQDDCRIIREAFQLKDSDDVVDYSDRYYYFYSVETRIKTRLLEQMENAKRLICSKNTQVVSFDIFDTLILRPFWTPSDLFYLLNDLFNQLVGASSYVSFVDIRIAAEKRCRERVKQEHREYDDITLDEIYLEIAQSYHFDIEVLEEIKKKEKELEIRFCTGREIGKQLYELAKSTGKRIVAASDMYLPMETVQAILEKNGYSFDRIFLSSDLRLAKATKRMYQYIQKELSVSSKSIIHVGDNELVDVNTPKSMGWNAIHLPRTVDLFCGRVPGMYKGASYERILGRTGLMRDGMNAENSYLGYRTAMALVANRLCDDPFETFSPESDFNADPYYVGYFALGQYLYAVTDWITQRVKRKKTDCIHFVARDGYLPMEAYRIFRQYDHTLPRDNYLYVSRKALALSDVRGPADLYAFLTKIVVSNFSPYKLEKMLKDYYRDGERSIRFALKLDDVAFCENFKTREQFFEVIDHLSNVIDYTKLAKKNETLASYFSETIHENDMMFDIGYSGRCESALTGLLGYPIDSLYIHGSSQILNDRIRTSGFQNETFYDFKPAIIGVVREHVFMCLAPSTMGYEMRNGNLVPVFEEYKTNPANEIITKTLQGAALDFVRDMKGIFGEYVSLLTYQKADLAYSFEYYLHYSKEVDRKIFGCVIFEDDVGLGEKNVSALSLWNRDIKTYLLEKVGAISDLEVVHRDAQDERLRSTLMPYLKWKKALCYLILDRKHFMARIKYLLKKE